MGMTWHATTDWWFGIRPVVVRIFLRKTARGCKTALVHKKASGCKKALLHKTAKAKFVL